MKLKFNENMKLNKCLRLCVDLIDARLPVLIHIYTSVSAYLLIECSTETQNNYVDRRRSRQNDNVGRKQKITHHL